jgi:hypothetical protein
VTSPIDLYLSQLRTKLESRFDSECTNELLSEIRAHLSDAACELEEEGLARAEAERLSISRFGAPEKAAFLLPWGQQFGTGDRYWGRGAFWIAISVALGLTWYAFDPFAGRAFPVEALRPMTSMLLVFYAYACWRARSFAMVKQSAIALGLFVVVTSLLRLQFVDPALRDTAYAGGTESLVASLDPGTPFLADLGSSNDVLPITLDSGPAATAPEPRVAEPKVDASRSSSAPYDVPGTAPFGRNPWALSTEGALPEVSQLLLSWLFLILMTNAAVCWIGCLEHEQNGGVTLVQ